MSQIPAPAPLTEDAAPHRGKGCCGQEESSALRDKAQSRAASVQGGASITGVFTGKASEGSRTLPMLG